MARRAYPRFARPEGPCVYLRREALELLGGFDEKATDIAHALTVFGERALRRRMLHVAADDVYVTIEPEDAQTSYGRVRSRERGCSDPSDPANRPAPDDPTDVDWSDEHRGLGR